MNAPPSPAVCLGLLCPITLHEFCEHYDITAEEEAKLAKVGYKLGGGVWGIEKLDQEEWQTWAGFVKLRWDEFLDQHKQFWVDVGLGLWDNPT